MVKVRMNTADVAAEVKCLRRLIGMRCANVYDISPKTYLFKLMNSSGITESGEGEKVLLLMESGVRLHTTEYARDKSTTPSGFTLKLRKHIRSRRLEDVHQLGYDRIVLFQFGLGGNAHFIILELYAQGNLLLTDSELNVLTLLRSHRDDDKGLAIMSRHHYPIEACRVFERTDFAKLKASLISCISSNGPEELPSIEDDKITSNLNNNVNNALEKNRKGNDGARSNKNSLKATLGKALCYGPTLSEHIILDAGFSPSLKVDEGANIDEAAIDILWKAVTSFEDWLLDVISGTIVPEGYILMKNLASDKKGCASQEYVLNKIYDEFCPILLNQFKLRECVKFETFDAALDEFYSKIESQRSEQQQRSKESTAVQKLEKIRADQENRVCTLKKEVDQCVKMAELIEYNLEDVDSALLAVRIALAKGMTWDDLARMVKEEKKSGNPIAGLIDKLYLERNCITLLLSNDMDQMDEDEKTCPVDKVEVDLALSAHANARRWYEQKKKQEFKKEKTVIAHEKAFKAAEKKTRFQIAQEKTVATISHLRKVHWFEKFNWFISSENYLIISGRDAQQNEMIVKRYMSKEDIYVHADLHGASSTVIKNHRPDIPIPPLTLNQTGCFTVCHSQAWDSKIITSAWWVYPHQVSKTAPTGEYLTVGSFMIRGKKNFLPPHPLVMGFGVLFRLDESSLGFHLNERRIRGEDESAPELETELLEINKSNSAERIIGEGDAHLEVTKSFLYCENYVANNSTNMDELRKLDILHRDSEHTDNRLSLSNDLEGINTSVRDKPCISKAERKKVKKNQKSGRYGENEVAMVEEKNERTTSSILTDESEQNLKQYNAKMVRGQRGKLKKIKEKYAEQDEEEREIRMALLASAGISHKKVKEEASIGDEAAGKPVKQITEPANQHDPAKICYKCKMPGHLSRDCGQPTLEGSAYVANNSCSEMDRTTNEMDKITMEEEGIYELGDEEKQKLNDLDFLTGIPLSNDVLLYALPVCAPYTALQSYKFRAKITPGHVKKGKAVKSAMNLFNHLQEVTNREKELMKACSDAELVAAIIGNVKITAPGLTQLKQKQKKGKKLTKNDI